MGVPVLVQPQSALIDVPVSSRAAIVDWTAVLAAALANLTAARAAGLDQLLAGGVLRAGTTQIGIVRPDPYALAVTSGAGGMVLGAYAQLAAANDLAAHALVALILTNGPNTNTVWEIATGAGGAEIVVARTATNPPGNTSFIIPVEPAVQIPANARVAVRTKDGSGPNASSMYGIFVPRPF